jgi:Luciferase-like monooxygenase
LLWRSIYHEGREEHEDRGKRINRKERKGHKDFLRSLRSLWLILFIGGKNYVMRFGLNFFPSFRLSDMSTAEYFSLGLSLSERADELGYSSVKTVEHYFHDYGGHSPNPIVFLSAVAARTHRIRLITGAVIPAFNNPIKLAGELAMLDNISNGRLDAGFGRAFIPKEFDVFA